MTLNPSKPPYDDIRAYFDNPRSWAQVSQALQRIALAIVGNERDAEDIVQGVWLEALQRPDRRKSEGWLRRLVHFRSLDALRRKRRDPVIPSAGAPEPKHDSQPDMLWKVEAQREVLDAVHSLKEPYLTTIVLRYFEGQGPKEIALQLGVAEETVKTRLTRAHDLLRARLGDRHRDPFGNWAPALLAYSGMESIRPSGWLVAATSAVLMKKTILIGAVLALILLVPLALQTQGNAGANLTPQNTEKEALTISDPTAEFGESRTYVRKAIATEAANPLHKVAKFAFAFPPKPDSEVGTLELQVRWFDGSPANNLAINIVPWGANDAFVMQRRVRTDSTGYVEVPQLAAGNIGIYLGRGGGGTADIVAGERTRTSLTAPVGTTFRGRVFDPKGNPVAGATVCLSDHGNHTNGEIATVCDDRGRYEVRDVSDQRYLSANAPLFAPSEQAYAKSAPGHTVALDLVLRGEPGTVHGTVLSPAGLPVIGARLIITGATPEDGKPVSNGRFRIADPLPFELRTDADGRFRVEGVGAGSCQVLARAESWEPWKQSLEIQPGQEKELTIRFATGVGLSGTVRTPDGRPASQADIRIGAYANLDAHRTKTNAAGEFHLSGLSLGPAQLEIMLEECLPKKIQVNLTSNTANKVDVTLREALSAHGFVIDEEGNPLAGWLVGSANGSGNWYSTTWTDSEGAFVLKGIPENVTELTVGTQDMHASGCRLDLENALPTKEPLHIVVPKALHAKSSLRMTLQLDNAPAPPGTRLLIRSHSPFIYREVFPDSSGKVHLRGLTAAQLDIEVFLEGSATIRRSVTLEFQEDLDLGALHLEGGGQVAVEVQSPNANDFIQVHVIDDRGKSLTWFDLENGKGISERLPTGPVRLRITSGSGAAQFLQAEIAAGETVLLTTVYRPGVNRQIEATRSNDQPVRRTTAATLINANGIAVAYYPSIVTRSSSMNPGSFVCSGLEVGSYRVRIQSAQGAIQELPFQITSLDSSPKGPLKVTLDW